MLRCMDSAVAGLRAHQNKMDVVGNNIANVNTVGYKAQTYTFQDAMYQTSNASTNGTTTAGGTNAAQYGYGALMGSIGMDMTASTPFFANGLNACIDGEGFFLTSAAKGSAAVKTDGFKSAANTDWSYTRVGQFMIDSNGYLTDANGNFVFGFRVKDATGLTDKDKFDLENLVPLRVPKLTGGTAKYDNNFDTGANAASISKNVTINALGEVTVSAKNTNDDELTAGISLGKVAIVTFQNPNGLTKAGGNYFKASDSDNTGSAAATPAGGAVSGLMPGYLEASNVDLAQEFSDMVTTHRGYQANTKMITVADEMLADLVSMKR